MKILIVDDKAENLYLLETLLKGSGYNVVSAGNGVEALEKLKKDSIDMIISDILMPNMDGFQLCRECKTDDSLREIPFVFYTATYTEEKDEKFALSLGAARFIVKPTEPDVFIEILKEVIRSHETGAVVAPKPPVEEEAVYFKAYNERLIKKLEDKMLDLERVNKGLKESEEKYSDLINNANDAVILVETTGYLSFVNPKFCEMTGYSMEEVKKLLFSKLIHPDDLDMVTEYFRKKLAREKVPRHYEVRLLTKAGKTIYIDNNTSTLEKEGRIVGVLKIMRDITERKLSQKALLESEEKFRSLFEVATEFIYVLDRRGTIMQTNPATVSRLGYTESELLGRRLDEFFTPASQKIFKEQFQILLEKGINRQEIESVCKDGTIITVDCSASVVRDERGEITYIVAFHRDITELSKYRNSLEQLVEERTRQLNKALSDAEEAMNRIDGILKSVADGLIVTDTCHRVILMNSAAEDLTGVRFSEVINQPIDFAIKENTLREKINYTLNKKKSGYEFDFELPGDDPKHPRIMRARTSVIHDKEGRQKGIVMIIQDVTHEREVDRMKTEFLSTAAHEFRTPLTSIQGFSEILLARDNLSEEERKKFLSYIKKQAVSLAGLVSDLLDVSRIESEGGFALNQVKCNAGEAIKYIIPYFQDTSSRHKIEVVLPDKSVELFVDKEKMEQVLKNILSNAIKYSPEGGVIRVVGKLFDDYYQVSVEDQGVGMIPEHIEKIFDKFYRADASDSAPEGTGLGMTIVKYIVEAHGGRVWVESGLGKGTTVKFTIPLGS